MRKKIWRILVNLYPYWLRWRYGMDIGKNCRISWKAHLDVILIFFSTTTHDVKKENTESPLGVLQNDRSTGSVLCQQSTHIVPHKIPACNKKSVFGKEKAGFFPECDV